MSGLAQSFAPTRVRVNIGHWLPVAAPLALLAVALAVASSGLVVQDTWLALAAGREVVTHGLPSVSHLTVLSSGHRWIDQQWLGQAIFYWLARAGGVGLVLAACLAATLAAFALCAQIALRRGASPRAILCFVGLAVFAAPWGFQLRPQSFGLLLFAVVLALLERDRQVLVLPVLCLWANVHGSVVLGVALAFAYAITTREPLLLLAPATLFASPYGLRLASYYKTMLVDPPFGHLIREWQRTTPGPLTAGFFALVLLVAALAWQRRVRVRAFDVVVLALLLAVGLDALRGTVWFGLAALAFAPHLATRRDTASVSSFAFTAVTLGIVVVALAVVATHPPAPLPFSVHGQRVLASDATADELLWQQPELRGRVAYDVAFELLTPAQIRRIVTWRNLRPGWQSELRGYDVVVDDPQHVAKLVALGGWRRTLRAGDVAVAVRR